jgi:two-component system, OmpR family, response regulator ChvI
MTTGYDVTSADGGGSALDHLAKDAEIDAVLLDWRMPGLDGLAMLRQMRERGHTMRSFS